MDTWYPAVMSMAPPSTVQSWTHGTDLAWPNRHAWPCQCIHTAGARGCKPRSKYLRRESRAWVLGLFLNVNIRHHHSLSFSLPSLIEFLTHDDLFRCDACDTSHAVGEVMYGCRACNYDLCAPCYDEVHHVVHVAATSPSNTPSNASRRNTPGNTRNDDEPRDTRSNGPSNDIDDHPGSARGGERGMRQGEGGKAQGAMA